MQDSKDSFSYDEELGGGYFVQLPSGFLRSPNFSPSAKLLYSVLLTYCGKNETAWPGQETLAKEVGISQKPLRAALEELVSKGLVKKQRNGRGLNNNYHITKFNFNKDYQENTGEIKNGQISRSKPKTEAERSNLPFKNGNNSRTRTVKSPVELYSVLLDSSNNIKIHGENPEPLPLSRPSNISIREHYRTLLSKIENNNAPVNPATGRKLNAIGVLAELISELYGIKVEPGYLAKQQKEQKINIWAMFDLAFKHAGDDVKGNPVSWLIACHKTKLEKQQQQHNISQFKQKPSLEAEMKAKFDADPEHVARRKRIEEKYRQAN